MRRHESARVSASYTADLELARRCAAGDEQAWERFMLEYRPVLYRAADALDATGSARDLADSLYADLYGIPKDDGQRKSLFNYFQGRSSLATWLRAVLAQRYVDRIRAQRRIAPLPDDERQSEAAAKPGHYRSSDPAPDPDRARHLQLLQDALGGAIADLDARDRLRLSCYYAQNLTLAETGRLLKEHEATVSRQLARTRRVIREQVERRLRDEGKLKDAQITQCFAFASEDAGPIDIEQMLVVQRTDRSAPEAAAERKEMAPDRSI